MRLLAVLLAGSTIVRSEEPEKKRVFHLDSYFKGYGISDGPIPVVFCGVNWSAEPYGLPTAHVTGMVEVVPVLEAIDLVRKYFPNLRRLGVLSEDSLSEHNNKALLEPKYRALGLEVTYVMAADFTTWKEEFERLQGTVDVLYLPTNGAVKDWNGGADGARDP